MLPTVVAVQLISQLQMSDLKDAGSCVPNNNCQEGRTVCGTQPKALQQFYTAKVAAKQDAPFLSGRCLRRTAPTPTQLASGFTLFEVLFVLIIVGF